MNEGLESLQEQIKKLQHSVDENHAMLVSIQRRARMSIIISSIKWLVILGITFGSFFFIQPYLDKAFSAYTSLGELTNVLPKNNTADNAQDISAEKLPSLFDIVKTYLPR
jgi:hypothetical protein